MNLHAAELIYLDNNASTFVDPQVAEAMVPYLTLHHGNPSSGHILGQKSRAAIDHARTQAANLLEVDPEQIIFTSGGTEANNHALMGTAWARHEQGNHLITSAIEHPAVSAVCKFLAGQGFEITTIPVDANGRVDPQEIEAACTDQTILISVMLANNEVGTLQPLADIAALARQRHIWCHTDAAQAMGKIPVSASGLGVNMLSVAGHKVHGPKGVGLLVIRDGADPANLMYGAGHEGGRRPGTENVAGIVGLGMACELAQKNLALGVMNQVRQLRDQMETKLLAMLPQAVIHARGADRLPNTMSVGFPGLSSPDLIAAMPEVAVSAGAACHGNRLVASHVLSAMGVGPELANGTLRFSLGHSTTEDEVERGLAALKRAVDTVTGGH